MDELLLFTVTSPSQHLKQTGSLLLLTLTSPPLQTGSFIQFLLTSSSLNSDGRAPTIHSDEPFTTLQTDGLPPTTNIDEPSTALQMDGLLHTIHIDEAPPSTQMDEPLLFTLTSPPLHFRWIGSFIQFILTKLIPQLRWESPYYSQ